MRIPYSNSLLINSYRGTPCLDKIDLIARLGIYCSLCYYNLNTVDKTNNNNNDNNKIGKQIIILSLLVVKLSAFY